MFQKIFFVFTLNLILSTILFAESNPKLNFDCSFTIQLGGYPSECFDQTQAAIKYITTKVRTRKRNNKNVYTYDRSSTIPSLISTCGTSTEHLSVRNSEIRKRNNIFYLKKGQSYFGLSSANANGSAIGYILIGNTELYIGGACTQCKSWYGGSCQKVNQ